MEKTEKQYYETNTNSVDTLIVLLRVRKIPRNIADQVEALGGVRFTVTHHAYEFHVYKGDLFTWNELLPNIKYLIEEGLKQEGG